MVTETQLKEMEKQGITEEWEKHGLICPYEDITTCDCCTNYGCIANKNPDKKL